MAKSELAAAYVADPVPPSTSTTVKQELAEAFRWRAADGVSTVVDCGLYAATFDGKEATFDDYDVTDLLQVLADVPTV